MQDVEIGKSCQLLPFDLKWVLDANQQNELTLNHTDYIVDI